MRPVEQRLGELAAAYGLDARALDALRALLDLLAKDEQAPTTVRAPEAAVDVHVADSLVALELPEVRSAGVIADLGAGAGFPGLVLAAALPAARVALVESAGRKCAFIARAAAAGALRNAEVVCARAEEWRAGAGTCDVVVVRAVAPLGVLVEYAAPLLREGGALVAYKGARDPDEEAGAARAADVVGLSAGDVRPVHPFAGAEHRHLYLYLKVRPTPDRFPRRAGMARKRPI